MDGSVDKGVGEWKDGRMDGCMDNGAMGGLMGE
jgi:hypothetical protein